MKRYVIKSADGLYMGQTVFFKDIEKARLWTHKNQAEDVVKNGPGNSWKFRANNDPNIRAKVMKSSVVEVEVKIIEGVADRE